MKSVVPKIILKNAPLFYAVSFLAGQKAVFIAMALFNLRFLRRKKREKRALLAVRCFTGGEGVSSIEGLAPYVRAVIQQMLI